MITVVIPAHNEQSSIGAAVESLKAQTLKPHRIIVVCDNCTDLTQLAAEEHGAETLLTTGNTHKKAGALNQALATILPGATDQERILVMDADTVLGPEFLAVADTVLNADDGVGAVGGVFHGEDAPGVLPFMQRNEYARYAREIERTGRVMVLTGTAALFRPSALRQVALARGGALPGQPGYVYDVAALTEDNELTLALKTRGWRLESPLECYVVTEVMPDAKSLWNQRVRWYRGAVENLWAYGFTRVTARYWGQQGMLALGVFAMWLYLSLTAITVAATGQLHINPVWAAISGVFVLERVVTVWRRGVPARLVAATLIPEMLYDMFLQIIFVRAVWAALRKREAVWTHLQKEVI